MLIVGAGPSGATLALDLHRFGVPFRLIDKAAGSTEQSRALGLQTRTLEMLHRISGVGGNVGEAVASAARPMQGFKAYGAGGHEIASLALALDPGISRYPNEMVLPQSRTQRLLLDHLHLAGATVAFDTEMVEMTQTPEGARALLRRSDGAEEWVTADWVVGADGASSLTRRLTGDNFVGAEYEERFLLADVTLRWGLSDDYAHIFLRPDGPIVAFPYPDRGRWRLIDTSNEARTGDRDPTVARFKRLFGEAVPDLVIEDAGWTSLFHVHRRLVERYRNGRVLLMGDAAHIHSPASGQGLNTGVQDASNLAWKLALVTSGRASHTLLDSYGPERRPVAEGVLKDSHAITEAVLTRNPVVEHVRDWMLRFVLGFDGVQHRIATGVAKIQTNYKDSPIIGNYGHQTAPTAGARMPDPILADGSRLSDCLAGDGPPRHHLLIVGGESNQVIQLGNVVDARQLHDVVAIREIDASAETHAADVLGARAGRVSAFLVRPDLYLGFCGRASPARVNDLADALGAALDRVFGQPEEASHARADGLGAKPYAVPMPESRNAA